MKKLAFLALSIVAAAGCSGQETAETEAAAAAREPSNVPVGVTSSQLKAFDTLRATTKDSWTWMQHETFKTPMHLSTSRSTHAEKVLARGGDAFKTTIELVAQHKELFKMRNPALELAAKKLDVDELGMTHARFQQMTHGVPVAGAELMAHYDAEGRVTSIDATYVPNLHDIDVQPKLATAEALALVKSHILTESVIDEAALEQDGEGKLVVYVPTETAAAEAEARLAYQFTVRAIEAKDPAIWVTTVDAKTGAILHKYNNLQTIQGSGVGVLGEQKTFEVAPNGTGFLMTDAASGVQIKTYTAKNVQTTPGTQLTSTSATSWDTGVTGAGAAVDAHFNASIVFKYYKDHHQRNAIDGAGGAMISTAHFGSAYDNAAWDGKGMLYGDGGQIFKPLSASVDVVGHEFTHGITEKTSALVYDAQSGALNEAVSDIFGAFIEHSLKPGNQNWIMGEDIVKAGTGLRDMQNPAAGGDPQPAHMTKFVNTQQDNGGVHINSGIINNAAFLMTVGGTNPVSKTNVAFGIGWEKSEKIWFRANTKYFQQTTSFGAAAQGVLQAAKDLQLTANEINIVDCAFKATGVAQGTCGAIVNPQSTTPGTGTGTGDGTGTGGTDGTTTGDGTTDGTGDTSGDEPAKPKATRRRAVVQENSGCSVSSTSGATDLGPLAGILAVVLGLGAGRRKKKVS